MLAVSNTSPIANLACIGRLQFLHEQFGEVWIPPAVERELANVPDGAVRKAIDAIKPEIDNLRAKAHFFIAPDLERAILTQAAEG